VVPWWDLRHLGGVCSTLVGSETPWWGLSRLGGVCGTLVGSVALSDIRLNSLTETARLVRRLDGGRRMMNGDD